MRTRFAHTERLHEGFSPNQFDLVTAVNCLDHSWDPWACVHRIVDVLKPGAWFIARHWVNEASHGRWQGLHQWNFWAEGDHWLYGNRSRQYDLTEGFRDRCITYCALEEDADRTVLVVRMQKVQ